MTAFLSWLLGPLRRPVFDAASQPGAKAEDQQAERGNVELHDRWLTVRRPEFFDLARPSDDGRWILGLHDSGGVG